MGAGGPGDHPFTDIVQHGIDLLGDGLDERVRRRVRQHPASVDQLADTLWRHLPGLGPATPDQIAEIRAVLDRTAPDTSIS